MVEQRQRADRGDQVHQADRRRPLRERHRHDVHRRPEPARRSSSTRTTTTTPGGRWPGSQPSTSPGKAGTSRQPGPSSPGTLAAWDDSCGGGLRWHAKSTYKNAITNELFVTLAALLHQRSPGGGYLTWAQRGWEWFSARGFIGPTGLVNDGITLACQNNGATTWTYNQGVILGGLAALSEITGDRGYLTQGEAIAAAALRGLAPGGILAEPCETGAACNEDQAQFKGIFVRYLYDFWRHSRRPGYRGVHPGQRQFGVGPHPERTPASAPSQPPRPGPARPSPPRPNSACTGPARSTRPPRPARHPP